ncbi:SPFH domain-containing protein, partial [Candidatus Bathyarchaeota archaeon]|nr:SPFH domain-containing protein [Candidatus Bathyarchaeota archaeon]
MYELEIITGVVAIVAIIVAIVMASGIKKVNQYEKGLVERWNAYERTADPGLRFIIPVVQRMYRVNMREQVIDVP